MQTLVFSVRINFVHFILSFRKKGMTGTYPVSFYVMLHGSSVDRCSALNKAPIGKGYDVYV